MENVVKKAVEKGLKTVEVYVKGPGAGRDSALRAIKSAGLSISLIADITPVPHNGPRAKKKRRI
jgi:small subunit ribosomal protein S11